MCVCRVVQWLFTLRCVKTRDNMQYLTNRVLKPAMTRLRLLRVLSVQQHVVWMSLQYVSMFINESVVLLDGVL